MCNIPLCVRSQPNLIQLVLGLDQNLAAAETANGAHNRSWKSITAFWKITKNKVFDNNDSEIWHCEC